MFSLLFFTSVLATVVYYVYGYNKLPKKGFENIPVIPKFSTFLVLWAMLRKKPHDEVEEAILRASGGHKIYLNRVGAIEMVTINDPELAKDLLSSPEDDAPKFEFPSGTSIRKFFGNGISFSNGDRWRTYKRLSNISFNNALSPNIFGEIVFETFDFMRPTLDEPIDIYDVMQRTTIEAIGKFAFGFRFDCLKSVELPHIITLYKELISIAVSPLKIMFSWLNKLPTESNRRFPVALKEFEEFVFNIIERKRNEIKKNNNTQTDVLSSMLELSQKEGIYADSKQLRDEVVGFFVAGHDTTSMALSSSLYFLAKHPEMQERAREEVIGILGNEPITPTSEQLKEMKYLNAIVKETLRIYPPAAAIASRKLAKQIKIGSYVLPANTRCSVNIWQIHHNPNIWEDPYRYNPERFLNDEKIHPFSWIPFSTAPRNCTGQSFSLMEQRIVLAMFLLKYKWTLPENSVHKEKIIMTTAYLLRPIDLKLVFTERNSSVN